MLDAMICPRCGGSNPPSSTICAFCGGTIPVVPGTTPAPTPIPEGWERFVDAWNGFSVLRPAGWQVVFHRGQVGVWADPSGFTSAYLIPGHDVQRLGAAGVAAMYAQWMSQSAPGAQARVEPIDPAHPERAHMRYRTRKMDRVVEGRATFLVDGDKLLIMGFVAPPELLPEHGPKAGMILSSFRPEALQPRQRVVEPGEQAFTACIPPGWAWQAQVNRNNAARKGMIRFTAAADPQGERMACQTDLTWSFQIGMGGFMNMFSGGNALPYMPASKFCHEWLAGRLGQVFPGHRPVETYERPDLARTVEAESAEAGTQLKASVAVLVTETQGPSGLIRQKAQVVTTLPEGAGVTTAPIWVAAVPWFYHAPAAEFDALEHVLLGVVESIQLTPAYRQREQQLMANYLMQSAQWRSNMQARTSQILSETSDIITSGYNQRQAAYDRISHDRSNATLGVQDMTDTTTGTVYSVPSGYDQYWMDPRGNIFGGNTMTTPGWDWTPMSPAG